MVRIMIRWLRELRIMSFCNSDGWPLKLDTSSVGAFFLMVRCRFGMSVQLCVWSNFLVSSILTT